MVQSQDFGWLTSGSSTTDVKGPLYGFSNQLALCTAGVVMSLDTIANRIGSALQTVPGMASRYANLLKPFGAAGGAGAWTMYAAGEIGAGELILAILGVVTAADLAVILAAAVVTVAGIYIAFACYKGITGA